jgi:predicted Zn-dependent protease
MSRPAGPRPPQELVELALSLSKADECVVLADESTSANLRWANNTLTSNGVSRSNQLTVVSIMAGATGIVSRDGATAEGIEDIVRASEQAARHNVEAEDRMPLAAGEWGDWGAPPAETSIGVFENLAGQLGEQFARAEASQEVLFGFASHDMTTTFVGSSSGLRARHDQPTGHIEINAKSSDFSRSVWAGAPTEDFTDVDASRLAAGLSRKLQWAERSVEMPAGRYEAILPPGAVADLMIYMYWSAGARDAFDGRTVFSRPGGGTRVGDSLAELPVTLRSDPGAATLSCAPFVVAHNSGADLSVFDNGIPTAPTAWVADGKLEALVQTRHSASLTGLAVTPYIDNLILECGGSGSVDDLVARTPGPALLLTCLWYIREVDPRTLLLTGLTRDGVFLVEGGEVVGAVNNFRFNESPVDLLARISDSGATERTLPREWSDYFTRTAMPALRIDGFNMSTVSQAY